MLTAAVQMLPTASEYKTDHGNEMVERLPFLRVLDSDRSQLVAEPDCRHHALSVAVRDVIL